MKKTDGNEIPAKQAPTRERHSSTRGLAQPELTAQSKPVADFQSLTKDVLTENFADIMETMAQKSIAGSLSHTKYLFEIGGVKEELQRRIQNSGEPTLAELLLGEVARYRDMQPPMAPEDTTETVKTCGEFEASDHPDQSESNCGAKAQ